MNIKKIIAVGMSVAMAVALIPASPLNANAAEKAAITLKNGKKAPKKIELGKKYKLAVKGKTVKFSSQNEKVVKVSKNTITGIASGKAKIVAKDASGKVVAKKKFVVLKRATKITVENSKLEVEVGKLTGIKATVSPEDSTDVLAYVSDNEKVAKVDAKTGKITGVSEGTANITVYAKATAKTKNKNKKNVKTVVQVTVKGEGSGVDGEEKVDKTVKELIPDVEKSAEALSQTSVGFILPNLKTDVSEKTVSVVSKKTSTALKIKSVMYSAAGTGIVELDEKLTEGNYFFYYRQGEKGNEVKIPFEYEAADEDDDDEESGSTEPGAVECDITVYVGSTDVTNKSAAVNASSGLDVKIKFDPADYDDSGDGGTDEEDTGDEDDDDDEDDSDLDDDSDVDDEPDTEGVYGYSTWSKYYAVVCVDGDATVTSGKITTKSDSASFVVLDRIDSYTIAYFTLTK